jgi:hypothetical protein
VIFNTLAEASHAARVLPLWFVGVLRANVWLDCLIVIYPGVLMAPKSSQIAPKFAKNLALLVRYAIDASTVVRGWDYTPAQMSRDMSEVTRAAGVYGGVNATGLDRWLKGATGFEPRTVLKFAIYLQSLTAEVKPGSDRDLALAKAYRNFAKTGGTHRIWGDTPQSALVAAYDWLLYGPGVDPPPGAGGDRHAALEWPNAATILGSDLQVASGLTMGAVLKALDALDPEQLQEIAGAAIDRLAEMAQVEGAIEVVEPELPCDPGNRLLLLMKSLMNISAPPTADDCANLAADTGIEVGRMRELLCGWDLPDEGECELLNRARPDIATGLISAYMATAKLKSDQEAPAARDN